MCVKGTMTYIFVQGNYAIYICTWELCHIYFYKGTMPYIFV